MGNDSNRLEITTVEQQKRNRHRYNIYMNGEFAFAVHEDLLVKHRLLKGERIDREQVERLLREEERHRIYLAAVEMIGRRPRTAKEIRLKLKQKGFDPEIGEEVILQLQDQKYIDDESFAKMWTEHRIYSQKKGKKWVEMELAQKGVSKEQIVAAVERIDEQEEFACALELAQKKWTLTAGDPLERSRKLTGFLLRRGYGHPLVRKVLRQLGDEVVDELND